MCIYLIIWSGHTLFTLRLKISGFSPALTLAHSGKILSRLCKAAAAFNYDFPHSLHPSIPLSCSCHARGTAPGQQLYSALVCYKILCTCFVPCWIGPVSSLLAKSLHVGSFTWSNSVVYINGSNIIISLYFPNWG